MRAKDREHDRDNGKTHRYGKKHRTPERQLDQQEGVLGFHVLKA